jgi:hypothetical protein
MQDGETEVVVKKVLHHIWLVLRPPQGKEQGVFADDSSGRWVMKNWRAKRLCDIGLLRVHW